jgi:hypothetical protein
MPEKETLRRARKDKAEGKAPSTQAGEFVHEEIKHVRKGKHGAKSAKQAIAIGLSKARRAGVKLPPPPKGQATKETRESAARALRKGQSAKRRPSATRSKATLGALKREGRAAASSTALSRQASSAARKRSAANRHNAAMKAVKTKGAAGRHRAAVKAATTRKRRSKAA